MSGPPSPSPEVVARLLAHGQALIHAELPAAVDTLLRPYLAGGTAPIPLWKLQVLALRRQGRLAEALPIQQMIVDTVPGDLPARYDLAEMLIASGDFQRGWREYRYRYDLTHTKVLTRHVQKPRWSGQPCPGQTLLIHDEQGYGDTFQFLRLVRPAQARFAGRVVLEVNPEALPFAQRAFSDLEVTPRGALPPDFDVHAQLMDLPAALGLELHDLPGSIPYLSADPARQLSWRQRLDALLGAGTPRVALVWAGRPTHPNDAKRSMHLVDFVPLVSANIPFLALQKGPAALEAAPKGLSLHRLDTEIHSFEDTAAILAETDLLISVDSSPVHLAGALGKRAWVLLPFEAEWRWMTQRRDTPWYPSHRLFRQPRPGDWQAVLAEVVDALRMEPLCPCN